MDPQEEIAAYLRGKGVQRAVLNDMLRGFAHDLAEAQRAAATATVPTGDSAYDSGRVAGMHAAADLIDPEVSDAE